ncbi:hypothetical protein [Campylobacter hyointestinalis]|uniref:hypothetical protein n=1 Tax=Campylobacter hyointestinalis TaxID=198 RepID=UPI000CE2E430|nr:hypothetical protein [Campylobacter hyointestinalis]PPB52759.1 hypothetical protein CDQ69_06900 [Campylobacter hyointestinalis subsp. hyointestinalis]PPB62198.1 hypothetical protein CDQ72_03700 [Campylobacter hyointestinalis subsp. hyointestinalis]PPB63250.1 hypothetical protein CDQ73_05865 [Campylobacter hyointestinalis subsp. hyointestinalis]
MLTNVSEFLDASVKKYPNKIAFIDENDTISYAKLQIGDLIVFENAGAYSVSDGISLFLSHTLPRILLLQKNKEVLIARDFKETFWLNFALPIDEK